MSQARGANLRTGVVVATLAASFACRDVDVVIARKDPGAAGVGGSTFDGDGGSAATGHGGGGAGAPSLPGPGGTGAAGSYDGAGGFVGGGGFRAEVGGAGGFVVGAGGAGGVLASEGGAGGLTATGGAGGIIPGMGGAGGLWATGSGAGGGPGGGSSGSAGVGGGAGSFGGAGGGRAGSSGLSPCPAETSAPATFVKGPWPYVEVGNIVVDASFVYLKVSDCCGAEALGLTLRVPLAGGVAEAVHTSARYHPGLAQDDDYVYLSAEEGLKIFAKAAGTLAVRHGLVYDGLAVRGGDVYGIGAGGLERVGPADVQTLAAAPWSLADIVVDARGVYGTNRTGDGQLFFYDGAGGMARALVPGAGVGGDLAQDDEYLYWAVNDELRRTRKSDGTTNLMVRAPAAVGGLTADSTHVYFTSRGQQCAKSPAGVGRYGGGVYRVRKPNGPLETRVLDQVAPGKIAVDDVFVYWVAGSNESATRTVVRLPR
jgi:hypothetical protein